MNPQSPDTDLEAERILFERVRQASVAERLARVAELNHACRVLALADIRRRYPRADADELRRRLARRLLPAELVERVYGPDA